MLRISDESYDRVRDIIEDIGYCCEVDDDYNEWEDIAASSMAGFLDELDLEQLEMTVAALEEYIIDTADSNINMAMGIKTALGRYIRERLEIGMTAAFSAVMVDEVILADKVSYSRKG